MFEGRDLSCEIVNEVNRAFVFETGPIRPLIDFLQSEQAGKKFKFQKKWYEEFNLLECSISKDTAFALFADALALLVREITSIVLSLFSHPFLRFYL